MFILNKEDSEYTPQSDEITGILKEMGDDMSKDLTIVTNDEVTVIRDSEELIDAKKKEVNSFTTLIETKTQRIGELAVSIKQTQNDLTDKDEALLGNEGFLAELEKGWISPFLWESGGDLKDSTQLSLRCEGDSNNLSASGVRGTMKS